MRIALACLILLIASSTQAVEHRSCYACGGTIDGAHFETKGHFYHPEHFTCAKCGDPIMEAYTTYRGDDYHNQCFSDHVAPRCALCRLPVHGRHVMDPWGNAYHEFHQQDVPSCDFCSRFATEALLAGGVHFSDGRFLCRICHASAVKSLAETRALTARVAARLRRFGMTIDTSEIRLHLVGRKKMQQLANNHSFGLRGFTDYHVEKNLFGHVRRREIDVYLLYGMPRIEMMGTIAHELAHVWQFRRGRLKHDRMLSEGSCNYAAYLILQEVPGPESEFMISMMLADEDPVYGDGFRRVKHYAENHGVKRWLALLETKNAALP